MIITYINDLYNNDPIYFILLIISIYLLVNKFYPIIENFKVLDEDSTNVDVSALSATNQLANNITKGFDIDSNNNITFKHPITVTQTLKSENLKIGNNTMINKGRFGINQKFLYSDNNLLAKSLKINDNLDTNKLNMENGSITSHKNLKFTKKGFASLLCPKGYDNDMTINGSRKLAKCSGSAGACDYRKHETGKRCEGMLYASGKVQYKVNHL